jgi:uncharacterized membrane protein YraQ (UPF0718 family)
MEYIRGFGILLVIAILGLAYVKWQPYALRTATVSTTHTLGTSIVSGSSATAPPPSWETAVDYARVYMDRIWQALALGVLLAATIETLIPRDWLMRVLGRSPVMSSLLGGALALPGMMCSCCAAPVGLSLRRSGASAGSAVAFWVGSPTLNLAVLAWIFFALGWQWAALRFLVGTGLVVAAAALVTRLAPQQMVVPAGVEAATVSSDAPGPWIVRWLFCVAKLTLILVPVLIVLVLLMGAARAYLFPALSPDWANSFPALVGLAVAGMAFPIPTGAEIPIIQTMQTAGLGSGPAAALLLTLAPLSIPSLAMVAHGFPMRVLVALAGLTVLAGVVAGLLAMLLGI